jgi:CRISPR/Cas system-associated exonuclease Cas4 (RecB family)
MANSQNTTEKQSNRRNNRLRMINMSTQELTPQFFYNLFSKIYYQRELPNYDNNEVSTTQAIQCLLKSFYERKLGRKLLEPKVVILSFGTIVHSALQDVLRKEGYETEVEKGFDIPNGTLFTHTDALHPEHSLEIKTITGMPHEILSQHYLQSNTYTSVHRRPIGYVGYIHKPSGICKVFSHQQDQRQFEYVLMRSVRLITHLKTNSTPVPEPSWLCQYCEYTDLCPAPKPAKRARGGL